MSRRSVIAPTLQIERLFGHAEWRPLTTLTINAGAMLEHNNLSGTDVAPQLALNYALAPEHVIRFAISRALRTPTPIEQAVSRVIIGGPGGTPNTVSQDLSPERILSREVGYVGAWPNWHATVDVKIFYDTIDDLIGLVGAGSTFPPTAFPSIAQNGDSARQYGAEGELTWRPLPQTWLELSAAHVETESDDRLDTYSTSAPRDVVHLLGSYRFANGWQASAAAHYQSAYRASRSADPQPAWARVDMRIARTFAHAGTRYEFAAVVENLFDRRYTGFRRDDVAQRRFWVTLAAEL